MASWPFLLKALGACYQAPHYRGVLGRITGEGSSGYVGGRKT